MKWKKVLNSFQLKLITVLGMTAGIYMATFAEKLARMNTPEGETVELTDALKTLSLAGSVLYYAVFPLAGFLVVQGILHTADKKKFLLRLLLAAVVSELVIDVADYGFLVERYFWNGMNFYFTLLIAGAALWLIEAKIKKYGPGTMKYNLLLLLIFLGASMVSVLLRTEQGSTAIMTIVAIYMFTSTPFALIVSVAALQMLFVGSSSMLLVYAPLVGIVLILMHNGEQGPHNRFTRLAFYAAYPAVYVLLAVIMRAMK